MSARHERVVRVVIACWLVGWFVNAPGERGTLRSLHGALALPLAHDAFPQLLLDPRVALVAYLAPLLALAAIVEVGRLARPAAWILALSSLLACLHLETAGDASYVTSLWVALWLLWLVHHPRRAEPAFAPIARGAAHAIVGLVFLGALSGKLTAQYWNGEAFHGLYFAADQGWPYPWLREQLTASSFRAVATWFSRAALLGEATLMLAPLLPTRLLLALFSVIAVVMMVARSYHLFSVLGCLLGLLLAAELLRREEPA